MSSAISAPSRELGLLWLERIRRELAGEDPIEADLELDGDQADEDRPRPRLPYPDD